MADARLIVIYPRPENLNLFERVYQKERVPMAVEKAGKTKIVASKIVGSGWGHSPSIGVAEVHFPTMDALQASAVSDAAQQTFANVALPAEC